MPIGRTILILALLAGVSCWASLAARHASADDRMEWQFNQSDDPANQGHMTGTLIYGVPETDNIQLTGTCDPSSGAKPASVVFGADIGDLASGKDVELRFSGGGFDYALKGQVYRPAAEEGLTGVHADIALDDPLWRAFAEKDSLDYLVPGYKAATLDLTSGKDKIAAFVQACRTYAAAPTTPQAGSDAAAAGGNDAEKDAFNSAKELGTVEAWQAFLANYPSGFHADLARAYITKLGSGAPQPQAAVTQVAADPGPDPSCKERTKLRSQSSNTATKLTVINKSGQYRGVLWLDFNGEPKSYANLNSGEQVSLDTFVTHPWMITDGPGNCLQIVMPEAAEKVVVLTGPGGTAGAAKQAKPASVGTAKKKASAGCGKGQISIEGRCVRKQDAAGFCGPGYHLQGHKCAQGYVAPKHPKSVHGCPPGQAWSPEEGCHEDD